MSKAAPYQKEGDESPFHPRSHWQSPYSIQDTMAAISELQQSWLSGQLRIRLSDHFEENQFLVFIFKIKGVFTGFSSIS